MAIEINNDSIICTKRTSTKFFSRLFIVLILLLNIYLIYLSISDSSTIWLAFGVFVFFIVPYIYRLLFDYDKIEANEECIIFTNTFINKNRTFTYKEITLFKSYLLTNSIGPQGGATAGESYIVLDIEFGDKFSTNVSDNEFDKFQELKLFIHSKI